MQMIPVDQYVLSKYVFNFKRCINLKTNQTVVD